MVTTSLSLHGVQAACATSNANLLSSYLGSRTVHIDLKLPGGDIGIDSRVVYTLSRGDECLIGLEFQNPDPSRVKMLRGFLLRRAGPEFVSEWRPD